MKPVWANDLSQLNDMELVKLEKDGLDILDDIKRFAEIGFDSVSKEDLSLLKWAGVYLQKPQSDGYFLMRVKIPGGIMNSTQARTLAGIARDYGRNELNITTRQAMQFHWLRIENLPDIFERLAEAKLSSIEACGDCPRTVVGNQLSGLDRNELFDTHPIVEEVSKYLENNRNYSNLPRKFKVCVSSNMYNPGHAEINDLAFIPAIKAIEGEVIQGFHVLVGGGLSAQPYLAQQLDIFVRPEEVIKVVDAVATIYRDHGYRKSRQHARLKFLLADWGPDRFKEELIKITGPLPSHGSDMKIGWNAGYFYGVHHQKQPGLNYVGLNVPLARLTADDLEELARLADQYGDGSLSTCNSQNIILTNIPDRKVSVLIKEKIFKRLSPNPKSFIGHAVACPGKEFCSLAVVETKKHLESVVNYLDQRFHLDTPLRIHMNGCPNSCGQQQIADIGLQGTVKKINGRITETFQISVGGTLGLAPTFSTKLKGHIPAKHMARAIEQLVQFYLDNRAQHEPFHIFVKRVGVDAFQAKLDEIQDLIEMVA